MHENLKYSGQKEQQGKALQPTARNVNGNREITIEQGPAPFTISHSDRGVVLVNSVHPIVKEVLTETKDEFLHAPGLPAFDSFYTGEVVIATGQTDEPMTLVAGGALISLLSLAEDGGKTMDVVNFRDNTGKDFRFVRGEIAVIEIPFASEGQGVTLRGVSCGEIRAYREAAKQMLRVDDLPGEPEAIEDLYGGLMAIKAEGGQEAIEEWRERLIAKYQELYGIEGPICRERLIEMDSFADGQRL